MGKLLQDFSDSPLRGAAVTSFTVTHWNRLVLTGPFSHSPPLLWDVLLHVTELLSCRRRMAPVILTRIVLLMSDIIEYKRN